MITYANPISQAQRTIDAKSHDAGSVISRGMVCQGINQSTAWIAKIARLACPQNTSPRSKAPKTGTSFNFSNAIETRDDPSYVEDIAREKLGLVAPNDRVFNIAD